MFGVGGGEGLGLRSGGPIAIIFSLVCIGIAAFSFLLDFDAGRPDDPRRRAGEGRMGHRARPDRHAGVALHRDPAAAEHTSTATSSSDEKAPGCRGLSLAPFNSAAQIAILSTNRDLPRRLESARAAAETSAAWRHGRTQPFVGSEAIANGRQSESTSFDRTTARSFRTSTSPSDAALTLQQRAIAAWLWSHRRGGDRGADSVGAARREVGRRRRANRVDLARTRGTATRTTHLRHAALRGRIRQRRRSCA